MRFPILVSPIWRPLLLTLGVSPERAYADIDDGLLSVRFGFFEHRFPLSQVESAAKQDWPYWGGIGWRTNFLGSVGIIGTYVNVVRLRFKERQRIPFLLPLPCDRLSLSLENPQAFLAALSEFNVSTATKPKPKAKAKRRTRRGTEDSASAARMSKRRTAKAPAVEEATTNGSSER